MTVINILGTRYMVYDFIRVQEVQTRKHTHVVSWWKGPEKGIIVGLTTTECWRKCWGLHLGEPIKRWVLFRCNWFDPTNPRGTQYSRLNCTYEVNHSHRYAKYDPFIIVDVAFQVFYIPYLTGVPQKTHWWAALVNKSQVKCNVIASLNRLTVVWLLSVHRVFQPTRYWCSATCAYVLIFLHAGIFGNTTNQDYVFFRWDFVMLHMRGCLWTPGVCLVEMWNPACGR